MRILLQRALAMFGLGKKKVATNPLSFYYPVTNRNFYQIAHDWGMNVITMCGAPDDKVHEGSRPYLGYVVHRPFPRNESDQGRQPTYVVTPKAEVWKRMETGDIPKSSRREEVSEETQGGTTVTSTSVIQSTAEPVIDHFLANPDAWKRHGVLEKVGAEYRLKLQSAPPA